MVPSTGSEGIQEELMDFLRSKFRIPRGETDVADVDNDIGVNLTALIASAVEDSSPKYSLGEVKHGVVTLGLASDLDALSVISLLIESNLSGARDLLDLVGECGSPKEVTISVQEVLERLRTRLESDLDDEEEEESNPNERKCLLSVQFIRLLDLYSQAIPRLKLRKKSARETLESLFSDLGPLFECSTLEMVLEEVQAVLASLSHLIQTSKTWSDAQTTEDGQSKSTQEYLLKLLCDGVVSLSHGYNLGLAQDKFYRVFPRLRGNRSVGGETGENYTIFVEACNAALKSLSPTWNTLAQRTRPGTLQVVARSWALLESARPPPEQVLESLLPLLIDAILTGHAALDESLFIILSCLYPSTPPASESRTKREEWAPTTLLPLIDAVTLLACVHPAPNIRLIAFRCVGGLLNHLPPLVHMQALYDLLATDGEDDEGPQMPMRVAAVGLLKDAVVDTLSSSSTSPFASPQMLQTFGPVVLRPHPPDLFSLQTSDAESITMEEFEEMDERKRLVECLSFYYVLISRDVDNRTGVRDSDQIATVERDLLNPLGDKLDRWEKENGGKTSMGVAALMMAHERVASVIGRIRSPDP